MAEGQPIHISWDLDGIVFEGPPPVKTGIKLLRRQPLTVDTASFKAYARKSGIWGWLSEQSELYRHRNRPINIGVPSAMRAIQSIAQEQGRLITFGVLSGREVPVHEYTRRELKNPAIAHFFPEDEDIELNEGKGSAKWKVIRAKKRLEAGVTAIQIEDDLEPAIALAELGVLVYLKDNITNRARILQWAGIELPSNIVPFNHFHEIPPDFRARLTFGRI